MTNELAIRILTGDVLGTTEQTNEAVIMAVKALSGIPGTNAEDLISRQEAIEALFELYEYQRDIDPTEAADLVRQGIYLAEKKIEQLPSAQPERKKWKWINTITAEDTNYCRNGENMEAYNGEIH